MEFDKIIGKLEANFVLVQKGVSALLLTTDELKLSYLFADVIATEIKTNCNIAFGYNALTIL